MTEGRASRMNACHIASHLFFWCWVLLLVLPFFKALVSRSSRTELLLLYWHKIVVNKIWRQKTFSKREQIDNLSWTTLFHATSESRTALIFGTAYEDCCFETDLQLPLVWMRLCQSNLWFLRLVSMAGASVSAGTKINRAFESCMRPNWKIQRWVLRWRWSILYMSFQTFSCFSWQG